MYLPKLIGSLKEQGCGDRDVEILVSDNASTDNTPQVCEKFRQEISRFTYIRNVENIGFDRNVVQLINNARGKYIWVLGSDDWIEPGAINQLRQLIAAYPDMSGLTSEVNTYSKDARLLVVGSREDKCTYLGDAGEAYSYQQIGYRLGFLSAHVFKREPAVMLLNTGRVEHNQHVVHGLLSKLISETGNWIFVHKPMVAWRSGNDSILGKFGIHRRYLVDIEAYLANVKSAFADKRVVNEFINNQLMYCVRGYLVRAISERQDSTKIKVDALRRFSTYRRFWLLVFPVMLLPHPAMAVLQKIKNKVRKTI
jgi:abequosyltransferase